MINVLTNYNELMTGKEKIKAELENELKFARNNYFGEFLKQKEKELKELYTSKINKLTESSIQAIKSELEATRNKLKGIIMKPIPEDTLNMLKSVEGMKLSDLEKTELMKLTEGNYMARRKVIEYLGTDHMEDSDYDLINRSPSLNNIIGRIDDLERTIDATIRNEESNSFAKAVIQNGDLVNNIEAEATTFFQMYE